MNKEFEKMMGFAELPHDACVVCGEAFSQVMFDARGQWASPMCDNCIDNALADFMVANLRQSGR